MPVRGMLLIGILNKNNVSSSLLYASNLEIKCKNPNIKEKQIVCLSNIVKMPCCKGRIITKYYKKKSLFHLS